jgi:DNA-binding response OmpR family regulator
VTIRILVVDDEPALRNILGEVLRREGYAVVEAEDGEAALSELRRAPVDLVITDRLMPGRTGVAPIRALQRARLAPRVLAISGLGGGFVDPLELVRELGVRHTLRKPFVQHELVSAVRAALAEEPRPLEAQPGRG